MKNMFRKIQKKSSKKFLESQLLSSFLNINSKDLPNTNL